MSNMHNPPHPGETLRDDVLPTLGLSVTDAAAQLGRNRLAEFDRQVADTPSRIEHIGLHERAGRAGIETGSAGAAMVGRVRLIVVQLQIGE